MTLTTILKAGISRTRNRPVFLLPSSNDWLIVECEMAFQDDETSLGAVGHFVIKDCLLATDFTEAEKMFADLVEEGD